MEKISPHPGEIPLLVTWDFTIPVVLRFLFKRKIGTQSDSEVPPWRCSQVQVTDKSLKFFQAIRLKEIRHKL